MSKLGFIVAVVLGMTIAGLRGSPADTGKSPDTHQLAADRLDAANAAYTMMQAEYKSGLRHADSLIDWSIHVLDAATDVGPADKALDDHLTRMQTLETMAQSMAKAGLVSTAEVAMTKAARLEATLWKTRGHR
jgi:outer membrane protein TolC